MANEVLNGIMDTVNKFIPGSSLVASLFGKMSDNSNQKELMQMQFQNQRALNQEQNEWQEYMYDKTNAYNDPSAQYQRYLNAGLNPVAYMSNGNVAAQTVTASNNSAPSPAEPAGKYGDLFSGLANDMLAVRQQELAKTELEQKIQESKARVQKLAAETSGIEIDNKYKDQFNEKTLKSLEEQIKKTAAETAHVWTDRKLLKAQKKFIEASKNESEQRQYINKVMMKYNIDNIVADTMSKKADVHLKGEQAKLIGEQIVSFILSNGEKAINFDYEGIQLKLLKKQDQSLGVDIEIKDNDEYKENARRFGYTQEQETKDYVNGILSSLSTALFTLYMSKGIAGLGKGSMTTPPTTGVVNPNTGYQGTYGPRP